MTDPRLQEHYRSQVRETLTETFGFENAMQVPRLEKVVVNAGVGDAKDDPKYLESVVEELGAITGQKPVVTNSKSPPFS